MYDVDFSLTHQKNNPGEKMSSYQTAFIAF